jgi:carboxypeptidase Taq
MQDPLKKLHEKDREIQLVAHALALLGWDQETYMPRNAIAERAEQVAFLEGIIHDKVTSEETGELFSVLGADKSPQPGVATLSEDDRSFVREFYRVYMKRVKLPKELVMEIARETSLSQAQWAEARSESDFGLFSPSLATIVRLTLRKAECIGYADDPYDPLLDDYEPWMKNAECAAIFEKLAPKLALLVRKISEKSKRRPVRTAAGSFDEKKQQAVSLSIMKMMGFDFESGRLDVSAHPFTTTLGSQDVRITTRYDKKNILSGIYSTIHETGHALYEQGFKASLAGTLLSNGASMGIHESQSRLWENVIGRSRGFSSRILGRLKAAFPSRFGSVGKEDFYSKMINRVEPSLIRTESDEVTYNLHIILRYNLETRLVRGELAVDDLPDAWKEESGKLLGIVPANDSEGVLQDIHWAMGAIGYFPTYSLGNLYSAQFYAKMREDIPQADGDTGSFDDRTLAAILLWLREHIHCHGSTLKASELCAKVTGRPLDPVYFTDYLEKKYGDIYEL